MKKDASLNLLCFLAIWMCRCSSLVKALSIRQVISDDRDKFSNSTSLNGEIISQNTTGNLTEWTDFDFQAGGFSFHGQVDTSTSLPSGEGTKIYGIITWFWHGFIEGFDLQADVPSGAELDAHGRDYKVTASWPAQTPSWTWGETEQALRNLAFHFRWPPTYHPIRVDIQSSTKTETPPLRIQIEKASSRDIWFDIDDYYYTNDHFAGSTFDEDVLPTTDAEQVLQRCKRYAQQRGRSEIPRGERRAFNVGNVRLEYVFGGRDQPATFTYQELVLAMEHLNYYFVAESNRWTASFGVFLREKSVAGLLSLVKASGIPERWGSSAPQLPEAATSSVATS